MSDEGVYYTYFIYEQIPQVQESEMAPNSTNNDIQNPGGQHLLGRNLQSLSKNQKTKTGQKQTSLVGKQNLNLPHIVINGKIEYINSDGYLNSEQRPYLKFYPLMTALYTLLLIFWLKKMK